MKEVPNLTDEKGRPMTYWGGLAEPNQDLPIVNGSYGCIIQTKKQEPNQETIEEVAENYANKKGHIPTTELEDAIFKQGFIDGAKWQAERSQKIVPSDAYNIEVFAIKPDENGQLFAYIGYKISNGNFEFSVVPFTEPQERMYSEQSSYSYDEVRAIAYKAYCIGQLDEPTEGKFNQWINQFKKETT